MSKSNDSLPSSVSSFKPEILKIKIDSFRSWIERRLTELLQGLEDDILCSLVFNYLEDAQKRAKREGPAANPSGALSASEVFNSLTGFLGQKAARDFVVELFCLLREAQDSPSGMPAEFAVKEAEDAAFGIIEKKKREMEFSERVKREVKRNDHFNRNEGDRHRDYDSHREHDRHRDRDFDSHRDRSYERRSGRLGRNYERHREVDHDRHREIDLDRRGHMDLDRHSRHHETDKRDYRDRGDDRRNHRDHDYERRGRDYERSERRDRVSERQRTRSPSTNRHRSESRRGTQIDHHRHRPRTQNQSPIPSSSPESPSPCWETSMDPSVKAAPRAPNAQEHVPNELERALRAKALQSQKKQYKQ